MKMNDRIIEAISIRLPLIDLKSIFPCQSWDIYIEEHITSSKFDSTINLKRYLLPVYDIILLLQHLNVFP